MKYRVYKSKGGKCIRKFGSMAEAQEWCWTRNTTHVYRIEWTYEGEATPRYTYC